MDRLVFTKNLNFKLKSTTLCQLLGDISLSNHFSHRMLQETRLLKTSQGPQRLGGP